MLRPPGYYPRGPREEIGVHDLDVRDSIPPGPHPATRFPDRLPDVPARIQRETSLLRGLYDAAEERLRDLQILAHQWILDAPTPEDRFDATQREMTLKTAEEHLVNVRGYLGLAGHRSFQHHPALSISAQLLAWAEAYMDAFEGERLAGAFSARRAALLAAQASVQANEGGHGG